MKYTHVVLEFWGMLQYDALPEMAWPEKSFSKDQIKPLIQAAHSYGMEVIPMLNHLGHATQSPGLLRTPCGAQSKSAAGLPV